MSNLPLSFQDAIAITRDLRVPYVWIDSMCIVQDSPSDWEKKAAEMCYVYSSSFLTTVAVGSDDSSQGYRTDQAIRPRAAIALNCSSNDSPSSVKRRIRISHLDYYRINLDYQPLQLRGWVLQERELIPDFYSTPRIPSDGNASLCKLP